MRRLDAIDDTGHRIRGIDPKRPKASLLEESYGRSATRMFVDGPDGPLHVGYVVRCRGYAPRWFRFEWVEPWQREA